MSDLTTRQREQIKTFVSDMKRIVETAQAVLKTALDEGRPVTIVEASRIRGHLMRANALIKEAEKITQA